MNKKILIAIVALIIVIPVAWYLISPIFIVVEADDESPLASLDREEKAEFERQVAEMKDDVMEMEDNMPQQAMLISKGSFMPEAHEVSGSALLIADIGKKTLRFEDFETINGPELHIYLAADLEAADYVDLGLIKATKGNVNYDVAANIDTEKYNKVLVWCEPFNVLFSYAELQ